MAGCGGRGGRRDRGGSLGLRTIIAGRSAPSSASWAHLAHPAAHSAGGILFASTTSYISPLHPPRRHNKAASTTEAEGTGIGSIYYCNLYSSYGG